MNVDEFTKLSDLINYHNDEPDRCSFSRINFEQLPTAWLTPEMFRSVQENMNDDYKFKVSGLNSINFKKIADDLSYADPLRIVTTDDTTYAVVHHTILDKALRSDYKMLLMKAVTEGKAEIKPKSIKVLVKQIREIKLAQWGKVTSVRPITVKVTKVKI